MENLHIQFLHQSEGLVTVVMIFLAFGCGIRLWELWHFITECHNSHKQSQSTLTSLQSVIISTFLAAYCYEFEELTATEVKFCHLFFQLL